MPYNKRVLIILTQALTLALLSVLPAGVAHASGDSAYTKKTLVSDLPGIAPVLDTKLVNPWGLSASPTGPWWISDNGSGSSSVYTGAGVSVLPAVSIPSPAGAANGGTPTGNVFNPVAATLRFSFDVSKGAAFGPSSFIFDTEDGTILGWNHSVDAGSAIKVADRSTAKDSKGDVGAVYKGLAFGSSGARQYIYATNFRFGTVEMFDSNFTLVKSFSDPALTSSCSLPGQCYAPFGIQNIHGQLYVTFALQDSQKHDDQGGPGKGFVDVFNTNGTFIKRLISHGALNSPWGLALAPNNFGSASNQLIVGNFGDGNFNVYDVHTGAFKGKLEDSGHRLIQANGLWALQFGNNGLAGKSNELFFTAGVRDEAHGVFGKVTANPGS